MTMAGWRKRTQTVRGAQKPGSGWMAPFMKGMWQHCLLPKLPFSGMALGSILNPTSTQFQVQALGNKEHQNSRD